jgi:glycine/D-amino acid oxidase-like deaminating enzyme
LALVALIFLAPATRPGGFVRTPRQPPVRVCVVGGGIAGALLGWRLARHGDTSVTLVHRSDRSGATEVSGGLARGYEPDRHNAELAVRSLAELHGSEPLRQWADLRRAGSVYVCAGEPDLATVAGIDRALGGVSLAGSAELAGRFCLTQVAEGCTAVVERQAGYLSPARLAEAARYRTVLLGGRSLAGALADFEPAADTVRYRLADGRSGEANVLVLAAGAGTPALLTAAGLPAGGLRTKLVRYTEFAVAGRRPPPFVDEPTGLYGRPAGDGGLLLGLPTTAWDLPADGSSDQLAGGPAEEAAIRDCAASRLAGLRLGEVHRHGAALDCYSPDGRLALRRPAAELAVFTFTGGSGGAAKTALAASADAAEQLLAEYCRPRSVALQGHSR